MLENIPKFIVDDCPSCDREFFVRSKYEFTGEIEKVKSYENDGTYEIEHEYIFKCCGCGARMWVNEHSISSYETVEEETAQVSTDTQPNT